MAHDLWSFDDLLAVVPFASEDGRPSRPISGFSIDTRTLKAGDIFVALKDQRDGHDFVTSAFKAGAAAAIVSDAYKRQPGDGALIRCRVEELRNGLPNYHEDLPDCDPLLALRMIGEAARARLSPSARLIAVTGSVGKTGTKEMLRAALACLGKVHASDKSHNNHWGVPLTLANMPAETEFAVFEIGMNHAGEITPLSKMVRPHVAVITTVEAVHLENFASVEAIADAKAEIFHGLVSGGAAILKRDNPHFDRLRVRAQAEAARVISFGLDGRADVAAVTLSLGSEGSDIAARLDGRNIPFHIAMPGRHVAENALAVLAALYAIGADAASALQALASLPPPQGRGARSLLEAPDGEFLLIDESYNANPASMRAALATLAAVPRQRFPRRIAVLGDMLELGPAAAEMHRGLRDAVIAAGVDKLFACGPHMKGLYEAAPDAIKACYAEAAGGLITALTGSVAGGDVVMIKGSNGMRLGPLVTTLQSTFARNAPGRIL